MTAQCNETDGLMTSRCVFCGYSFIQYEILPTGVKKVHRYKNKLKLNNERLSVILEAVEGFKINPDVDKDNEVWKKLSG